MAWEVVQRWVRKQGRAVSISEIAAGLKLTHAEALRRVKRLVEAGELIDRGGDRITAPAAGWDKPKAQAPDTQRRIWEAANYRDMRGGSWTAAEIARVAESSPDYVKEYLAYLEGRGLVHAQRRPGKTTYYRLHPDAPAIGAPPIWTNRKNRELRAKRKSQRESKP